MGIIGRAFQVFGVLVLLLAGAGSYLYLTDYAVEATVTDKSEDDDGPYIVLTTTIGEYALRHDVPRDQWLMLQVGNYVVYHINTQHVLVYSEEGGQLLYDSASSPA